MTIVRDDFWSWSQYFSSLLELIAGFDRILKPGGRVCFGAEPITPDFPLPWGLRMDDESLWAISKNGWLELGYNQSYFETTMARFGWLTTFLKGSDGPWSSVILAKRKKEIGGKYSFQSGGLKTQVGKVNEHGSILTTGVDGYLAYGPYAALPKGDWLAAFICDDAAGKAGKVLIDIVHSGGTKVLAMHKINLAQQSLNSCISISFSLEAFTADIEVRVRVFADTCF